MNMQLTNNKNLLPCSFYQRSTIQVAKELLGKKIVRNINGMLLAGIISETEAYGGANDPASHAYNKKTARNAAMFGPVGHCYVYMSYGIHYCLNIVAKEKDVLAGAVLIRSIIPISGIEMMCQLRNTDNRSQLTNGPGKVAQALNLNRDHNTMSVIQEGELCIAEGSTPSKIIATPRIGISKAQDKLWRFLLKA